MSDNEISDRCPSCGWKTLFIGKGGWITCSLIGCKEPGLSASLHELTADRRRLEKLERMLMVDTKGEPYYVIELPLYETHGVDDSTLRGAIDAAREAGDGEA